MPPTLDDALFGFAEVAAFWAEYAPLSADGRAARDARPLPAHPAALEAAWDDVDEALTLLVADPHAERGLAHHLGRLPALSVDGGARDVTDLFLVKRALTAHRAIAALLPERTRAHFALAFGAEALLARLSLGHDDAESFHLAEAYSEPLTAARAALREHDAHARAVRLAWLDGLRAATGLDLRFRDFVMLPAADAAALPLGHFALTPGDAGHLIARPLLPASLLALAARRDALIARERAAEEAVLEGLLGEVRAARATLTTARQALTRFDLAFARARLARRYAMVRPELTPATEPPTLLIEAGRLLPLEARCATRGARYWPLDLALTAPVAVVAGANMGGKTVALATVGFLQALAQLGFFVPARRLRTSFYDHLACVGGHRDEAGARIEGLSSFGLEIDQLVTAWRALEGGRRSLVLIDELARTTSSTEAAALLTALLGALAFRTDVTALLSTHVADLALPATGVACFRMAGLDGDGLQRVFGGDAPLAARVRQISDHMTFALVPSVGLAPTHEALNIAAILGLDARLVRAARRHLGGPP